jgi:hypothetical protein
MLLQKKYKNNKYKENPKTVKEMVKDKSSEDEEGAVGGEYTTIYRIFDNSYNGGNIQAELDLKFGNKWTRARCDLDTGANLCVVGWKFLNNKLNGQNVVLEESFVKLTSFSGNPIKVLGKIIIPCRRKSETYKILFYVVNMDHGPLLSANACKTLGFVKFCNEVIANENCGNVKTDSSISMECRLKVEKMVDEFKDDFHGIGLMQGDVE